jgi:amino acid transporter
MDKASEKIEMRRSLTLLDLVLFNVVAIVGLRWISNAAGEAGQASILLWITAMLFFFIPSSLVVAELSSKLPGEGGIYLWTRTALGDFHGFICGFFYWISNFSYYPNLLIYTAGVSLYILGNKFLYLENNSLYACIFSLALFWLVTYLNIIGVKTGKKLQFIGFIGTWFPVFILVVLGVVSYIKFGSANRFAGNMIPKFDLKTIAVFANLCFSFAGMELQSSMGSEIQNPRKNIPKAIFISGIIIASLYILGTITLLLALPADKINIVTGIVQVINTISGNLSIVFLGPIIALLVLMGNLGGCGAWLSGAARIPFAIGIDRYLPDWIAKVHPKWKTPVNSILTQTIISSVFIILSSAGSNTKEAYILLVDSTIILYFLPYLYLFISYILLKRNKTTQEFCEENGTHEQDSDVKPFNLPIWVGYIGIFTTLISIALALVPPKEVQNVLFYELKIVGGVLFFFLLSFFLFFNATRKKTLPR